MSMLIKGLKLPPVGIRQCIVSFADNCLLITDVCGKILFEGEYVEVPTPHGRLIDADKLIRFIENGLNKNNNPFGYDAVEILTEIEFDPTIIEAEVSE